MNLGWKLAAAVRGWAADGLLDSYHAERRPAAARVLHNTRAQAVLTNPAQDEDVAAVRDIFVELLRLPAANHLISGMMSGLYVQYSGLGPRMLDLDVVTPDGPVRVSRLLHSGRGLLLSLDGSLGRSGAGRREWTMSWPSCPKKPAPFLIRPDGYIAWSAADEQPLETALARWFG